MKLKWLISLKLFFMIKKLLYLIVFGVDLGLIFLGAIDWKLGIGILFGFIALYTIIKRILF